MYRPRFFRQGITIPLGALQEEINRVLAHYRAMGPIGPAPAEPAEADSSAWEPPIDLVEDANEVCVWADLPGIDPATIELTVTGPTLTLRGDRRPVPAESGRQHLSERAFGPFLRQVQLPSEVDLGGVRAEAHHGVLEIHLPKAQAVRPRTIPITPAGA
jgi:HSP20 family protein